MIGLGTQDDLKQANDFVDAFGLTHTMLWDESFQSWAELGVSLQPSAKLYAADGSLLGEWLGRFDDAEVLALVADSNAATAEQAGSPDTFCRFTNRFARAQADAAAYATVDSGGRQRIVDDLRYAANAMAQTIGGDSIADVERLAAAVRDHSQVLIDAGLPADVSSVTGLEPAAAELTAAIGGVAELSVGLCGVALEPAAVP